VDSTLNRKNATTDWKGMVLMRNYMYRHPIERNPFLFLLPLEEPQYLWRASG